MKVQLLRINQDRHEVFLRGKRIDLPPKEYGILVALTNSNATMSRELLMKEVWEEEGVHTIKNRTVDIHVARLRRRIGAKMIETVTRVGYRIAA